MLWGFFPRGPGFRSSARGGPEASFFSSFRAFFPFFLGRFVLYLVRLKPFVQFVSSVFPSSRTCGRNQRFRCFCGYVGQRNPRSRSPFPFFFLPFLPFCPLRVHIRSVSGLRDTKCSLQQRASMTELKSATPKLHCARIGVDFITMV